MAAGRRKTAPLHGNGAYISTSKSYDCDTNMGGDTISGNPVNQDVASVYRRKIGKKEMTIENIRPNFSDEKDREKNKTRIMDILYEIFSKYEE